MVIHNWKRTVAEVPKCGSSVIGCWWDSARRRYYMCIIDFHRGLDVDYWMEFEGGGYRKPPDYWQYLPDPPEEQHE